MQANLSGALLIWITRLSTALIVNTPYLNLINYNIVLECNKLSHPL